MAWTWHLAAALACYALVAPAVAVSSEPDTGSVLQEVRLLRLAIESLARTNSLAQISFGRLQIQEQRTVAASAEWKSLARHLSSVISEMEEQAGRLKELEDDDPIRLTADQRADRERFLEYVKDQSRILEVRRQKLIVEEAAAAQVLALEQARWVELNQKLDDLERAMAPKPR